MAASASKTSSSTTGQSDEATPSLSAFDTAASRQAAASGLAGLEESRGEPITRHGGQASGAAAANRGGNSAASLAAGVGQATAAQVKRSAAEITAEQGDSSLMRGGGSGVTVGSLSASSGRRNATAAPVQKVYPNDWNFDRVAQALQDELFDLRKLTPGGLRPLDDVIAGSSAEMLSTVCSQSLS